MIISVLSHIMCINSCVTHFTMFIVPYYIKYRLGCELRQFLMGLLYLYIDNCCVLIKFTPRLSVSYLIKILCVLKF